ncbi:hypothetical protein Anas_04680 [Armadillidium nasatum]|uniref:Uncharacterized protein n=1 Tax=Armadillidium nasatum TaxID=96803 RepID=A0A5N5SPE3_9CRUS|nr:hypothetical protein Anas_04680 [Armadillidium nasatum]
MKEDRDRTKLEWKYGLEEHTSNRWGEWLQPRKALLSEHACLKTWIPSAGYSNSAANNSTAAFFPAK